MRNFIIGLPPNEPSFNKEIIENRGVVWFVEKNKETASSEYSRGDSYGLHKNLSLQFVSYWQIRGKA